jgi:hypothetical protein
VLSGQAEREAIMRALPVTHQFLHKPCDGETLRAVIEQTHALHKLMQNPALTALVGKLERIPAVPTTYTELSRLAQDPKADSVAFAKIIEMDAAVCAKVLQLVNSAYFGLGQKIVSIRPAVTYLGVEIIKSLVLSSSSFSDKAISEVKGFSPDRLQHHSMLTALLAKKDRIEAGTGGSRVHGRPAARHRRAGVVPCRAARLRARARPQEGTARRRRLGRA